MNLWWVLVAEESDNKTLCELGWLLEMISQISMNKYAPRLQSLYNKWGLTWVFPLPQHPWELPFHESSHLQASQTFVAPRHAHPRRIPMHPRCAAIRIVDPTDNTNVCIGVCWFPISTCAAFESHWSETLLKDTKHKCTSYHTACLIQLSSSAWEWWHENGGNCTYSSLILSPGYNTFHEFNKHLIAGRYLRS